MFVSISRIKKLFKNPIGGLMFLIQWLKSLMLKFKKVKNVDLGFANNKFLVDSSDFWDLLNTNFDFQGIDIFGTKVPLDNIQWNYDYLNDFEIPPDYYFKLREWIVKNSFKNFDVKNVWELSRCYFLKDIALMYGKTKDDKYLNWYKNIIESWINQNPYLKTCNWSNPMEVSIRSINWILSFQILQKFNTDYFDEEFLKKYYTNLNQSFLFLINNIENYPFKSNHYLVDNLGIFILGLSLKNINKKWLKLSFNNLLKTLFNQFSEDGVDFENSSNYHLLKLESLLIALKLYKLNESCLKDVKIEEKHWDQLKNIYTFGIYLFKDKNNTFCFGDNDETVIYKIDPLKTKLEVLYKLIFNKCIKSERSLIFDKSGFGFLKNENMNICFLRGNTKHSSHFHNDLLSLQLSYNNCDFFIDPNTFNYNLSKNKREYYLSTQRHNTCFINNTEQSKLSSNDPFLRCKQNKVIIGRWDSSLDRDEMCLGIQYKDTSHLRSLVLNNKHNKLSIFDTFSGKINVIEWNFYLPKSVNIKSDLKAKNVLILENNKNKLVLEFPETLKLEICDACISERYNNEEIGSNIKLIYINKQKLNRLSFQIDIKEKYLN